MLLSFSGSKCTYLVTVLRTGWEWLLIEYVYEFGRAEKLSSDQLRLADPLNLLNCQLKTSYQGVKNKHSFVMICVFGLCQFIKAIFIHQNHNRSEDQKEMTVQFFQWPLRLEQSEHLKINRWKKERIEFPNFLATQYIEFPAFMSDCQPKNTKSKRKAVNKTTWKIRWNT